MNKYNFDELSDRSIDNARKWDRGIVTSKFPEVREDFIPMWIADMDFRAAPEIREALVKMAENGAYGYTYSTDRWYQSVINWYQKRHHIDIEKDWITLGYGTVPNMHIIIQEFLNRDDTVLLNTPTYGPFDYAAEHNQKKSIKVPLIKKKSKYFLDFEQIEKSFKNDHVKVIFFCNPHNPSGRIWTLEEITKIADLCEKYDVILVSDEVHSEHIISGKFYSALDLDKKYYNNLIVLTSPNKAFNLGGLKLSYSIIPNEKLRDKLRNRYLMNSVTSPNVPGQIAMTVAYESGYDWLIECENYIKENLEITKKYIDEYLDGWELMDMESSYLPWIDISKTEMTMEEVAELMAREAGVILGVGDDYVADAEGFLRLNLGTSKNLVEESMKRMSLAWQNRK